MSEALPRRVPLPDVPEYTNQIVFGDLGLPVGFDDERLVVNLRGIEKVRSLAGLGEVSIHAVSGEAGKEDMQIGGVGSSGAIAVSAVIKRRRNSLANGSVTFPTSTTYFGRPDANIMLNRAEMNARISDTGKYRRGLLDANGQAKVLNEALGTGLNKATTDANFSIEKGRGSLRYYGIFSALTAASGSPVERAAPIIIGLGMPLFALTQIREGILYGRSPKEVLQLIRPSIFVGCSPDRAVAAYGAVATRTLIKVA